MHKLVKNIILYIVFFGQTKIMQELHEQDVYQVYRDEYVDL